MFAIIETGGKQYKVEKGTTLDIEKVEITAGETFEIKEVLLVDKDGKTEVGTPHVKGATVTAKVVEQFKDDKIIVFKMKAKKRYKRTQGHRQPLTKVEIVEIKA